MARRAGKLCPYLPLPWKPDTDPRHPRVGYPKSGPYSSTCRPGPVWHARWKSYWLKLACVGDSGQGQASKTAGATYCQRRRDPRHKRVSRV